MPPFSLSRLAIACPPDVYTFGPTLTADASDSGLMYATVATPCLRASLTTGSIAGADDGWTMIRSAPCWTSDW